MPHFHLDHHLLPLGQNMSVQLLTYFFLFRLFDALEQIQKYRWSSGHKPLQLTQHVIQKFWSKDFLYQRLAFCMLVWHLFGYFIIRKLLQQVCSWWLYSNSCDCVLNVINDIHFCSQHFLFLNRKCLSKKLLIAAEVGHFSCAQHQQCWFTSLTTQYAAENSCLHNVQNAFVWLLTGIMPGCWLPVPPCCQRVLLAKITSFHAVQHTLVHTSVASSL